MHKCKLCIETGKRHAVGQYCVTCGESYSLGDKCDAKDSFGEHVKKLREIL